MTAKFGRTYRLQVAPRPASLVTGPIGPASVVGPGGVLGGADMLTIEYPLTLKFDVTHNTFSDSNNMSLQIYNLSTAHQKQIYWDQYIKETPVPIILNAGYQSMSPSIPQIFTGYVKLAYTERLGSDMVTHIEAYDGGYAVANGQVNYTAPIGSTVFQIFRNLVRLGLPGVTVGQIIITQNIPPPLTEVQVFCGSTIEQIQKIVPQGGNFFISDGIANLLGFNDQLPAVNSLGVLSTASGLLGVPKREGYHVTAACIFEPRMRLGQTLTLNSTLTPWVNGLYKINGFHHVGTISGVESGEARTEVSLFSLQTPQYP